MLTFLKEMKMMPDQEREFPPYQIIHRAGCGIYEEKKSRFIADIVPVHSEEEAVSFIESVKKKYYDARHHCTAYIIGRNRQITRCSDDGEPSGTAGRPMLEVLLGAEVVDAAAVVTRYFGGTLLGTGGLVRAYTQAMQKGLENAEIQTMHYGTKLTIGVDYTDVGKVQYLLGSRGLEIAEARYAEKAAFDVCVPMGQAKGLKGELTEATAGRARIDEAGRGYYHFQGNF